MAELKTDIESNYQTLAALKKLTEISMGAKKKQTKEEDLRPVSLDEFTEHIKSTVKPKAKKPKK